MPCSMACQGEKHDAQSNKGAIFFAVDIGTTEMCVDTVIMFNFTAVGQNRVHKNILY